MIVLDENFPESQRQILKAWHIPVRQIGVEIRRKGIQDDEIIPLLLALRRPTFFTLDGGFYSRRLGHARYCLVCVDVGPYEAAAFVRRLLGHKEFDTETKRMARSFASFTQASSCSVFRPRKRRDWIGSSLIFTSLFPVDPAQEVIVRWTP